MKNEIQFFIILLILFKSSLLLTKPYINPVINEDAPDPSVIKVGKNYYLYSTGEKIFKSSDLINWKFVRRVFEGKPRPSFVKVNSYWAPCITKQNNLYILYFALSVWGGIDTAGIGVATSKSPEGPFDIVGNGKLFNSGEVGIKNSIDPYFIEDNEKKYLIWGSFYGIYGIELTKDGTKVKNIKNKFKLGGKYFEAAYIFKRNKYYYLFASIGSCCEGDNSKYQTVVGRSDNLKGPYLSKNGGQMLSNQFTVLLSPNKKFVGPGHNSRIVKDKNKKTWMLYHAYLRGKTNIGRTVCLDEVKWTKDNWPYFEDNSPSSTKRVGPYV